MSNFVQTTLGRYARWGVVAVSIVVTAACGGGGGGGGGGTSSPPPSANAVAMQSSDSINLVVNASRVTGVAPLAISFDTLGTTASALTALPFHEVKYSWDFGDHAAAAKWSYGVNGGTINKNTAMGPLAAHVFESHGTFTVTVTAYHGAGGNSVSKSLIVTVLDPSVVFKDKTICLSNSNLPVAGVGGCPADAHVQQVTDWAALTALSNTYKRILLKRGEIWNASGTFVPKAGPGILAAYGSGSNPVVSLNNGSAIVHATQSGGDWRILDLVGTTAGYTGVVKWERGMQATNSVDTLFLRCDISNAWVNFEAVDSTRTYLIDSIIHNPMDYGVAGPINVLAERNEQIAMIGSYVYGGTQNHAVRFGGARRSVIQNNTIVSARTSAHTLTVRGYANNTDYSVWSGVYTEDVVISENVLDAMFGGITVFTIQTTSAASVERHRNIIVERNLIKGKSVAMGLNVHEGLTVRNNISVTTEAGNALVVSGPAAGPAPTSSFIYNNTFYKPDASVSNTWAAILLPNGGGGAQAKGTVIKNNISYAPGNLQTAFLSAQSVPVGDYVSVNNSTDFQVATSKPWSGVISVVPLSSEFLASGYPEDAGVPVPVWENFSRGLNFGASRSMGAVTR